MDKNAHTFEKNILIGIPALDSLKIETTTSLVATIAQLDMKYDAKMLIRKASLIHDSRNKIAQQAIDEGFDYLMFIDSDMKFPGDALNRLMSLNLDVVGGLYYRKQPPHAPVIAQKMGKTLTIPRLWPKTKPFEVFSVATGFMLINTKVLKAIKPPYFFYGKYHDMDMGEDVYFCHKAQQAGFKVWCDPTIDLKHIGEYEYDAKDYEAYAKDRPEQDVDEIWNPEI